MTSAYRSIASPQTHERRLQTPLVCQAAAEDVDYRVTCLWAISLAPTTSATHGFVLDGLMNRK